MARFIDNPFTGAAAAFDLAQLKIDRDAEVPICVQLGWALRAHIDAGTLAPGQRLPGLRDLADALGVNVNTARTTYQRLERTGLIESRQGSGTFVSKSVTVGGGGAAPKPGSAGRIAADAARQARERGVDPREVAAALYVSRDAGADGSAPRDPNGPTEAARRLRLREQIASLERALGAIEAEHSAILPARPASRRGTVGPALVSVAELESTRAQLVRRLTAVQAAIEEHEEAERGDRAMKRERIAEPEANAAAKPKRRPAPGTVRPATAGT